MWQSIVGLFSGVQDILVLLRQVARAQSDHALLVVALIRKVNYMTQEIDDLTTKQDALEAKIDESNATLKALATAVVDLRNLVGDAAALKAAVIHAADRADKMLVKLAAAEDEADNVFETPPGPETPIGA